MEEKNYWSDLTNERWELIKPLLPESQNNRGYGRPRIICLRIILNAIFYLVRTGCQWRMLPHNFPNWKTVYHYFRKWRKDGTWERIHDNLHVRTRLKTGREGEPSAGIIDSQSVKTTEVGGLRGYDAGKKINGRKRHIIVDTMGLLIAVVVHEARIQDRDGAKLVFMKIFGQFPRLKHIWADGGYSGKLIIWANLFGDWALEIVKRVGKGFMILPRRWVVERTFAWIGRYRRMSKDYEYRTDTSESMIRIAMIQLMLRRLAPA
ncbi:MAG: IS5 family transposase [bacterium]